jgi:hypothetical protein
VARPCRVAAAAAASADAVASPGDYLEVEYVVYSEDGTEVDSSKESGQQACFILGSNRLVAGFHQAVGGLAVGESRRFKVSPEDAYGAHRHCNIRKFGHVLHVCGVHQARSSSRLTTCPLPASLALQASAAAR